MGRKRGRHTKLTPKVQEQIVLTISKSGSYAKVAAQAVGISERLYYKWLTRGENGQEPYLSFLEAVRQAEAQAEVKTGEKVFKGKKNWVSAATWLERTRRERWSRSDKLLIGPSLGPIEFTVTGPSGGKIGSDEDKRREATKRALVTPRIEIDVIPSAQDGQGGKEV